MTSRGGYTISEMAHAKTTRPTITLFWERIVWLILYNIISHNTKLEETYTFWGNLEYTIRIVRVNVTLLD